MAIQIATNYIGVEFNSYNKIERLFIFDTGKIITKNELGEETFYKSYTINVLLTTYTDITKQYIIGNKEFTFDGLKLEECTFENAYILIKQTLENSLDI